MLWLDYFESNDESMIDAGAQTDFICDLEQPDSITAKGIQLEAVSFINIKNIWQDLKSPKDPPDLYNQIEPVPNFNYLDRGIVLFLK